MKTIRLSMVLLFINAKTYKKPRISALHVRTFPYTPLSLPNV